MANKKAFYVSSIKKDPGESRGIDFDFDLRPEAKANAFRLKGHPAVQLGAFELALKDFEHAKVYSKLLLNTVLEAKQVPQTDKEKSGQLTALANSLWVSAISTFARSFTDSDKWPKLDLRNKLANEDETLAVAFDKVMELRHKFISHRDDVENEAVREFLVVSEKEKGREYGLLAFVSWMTVWEPEGIQVFGRLIEACQKIVGEKKLELTDKIVAILHREFDREKIDRCLSGEMVEFLITSSEKPS